MRGLARGIVVTVLMLLVAAEARAGTIDRLYVVDCGHAHAADQSLWSPGVNVGVPIMQQAEWDYAATLPQKPFDMDHPKKQLVAGDKDLFGDGSLVVLATPGHTPGHESLLVHLPKTGYVVLAGDVAHFQANWDNRRVPGFNADKGASLTSMEKVARIVKEKHAQLWLNHDKPSSDARLHAPQFYE